MTRTNRFARLLVLAGSLSAAAGCVGSAGAGGDDEDPLYLDGRRFGAEPEDQKSDSGESRNPVAAAGAATEVWEVRNQWADTNTDAASESGIAWPAQSGLTWKEKYSAWIASMRTIPTHEGSNRTVEIPTPYGGRTFPAPSLECAEVALFLRATFASWYHLPFFMTGHDGARRIFAGHFGFIDASGARIGDFPAFRTAYEDHEGSWAPGDAWIHDSVLQRRNLESDDEVPFLPNVEGRPARFGAYADELFLNKRAGHFLRYLLLYFGSINLADGANMFHVEADAVAPGDVLLERYDRTGIGHTIPVFKVEHPDATHVAPKVATGSMPRRQPVWNDTPAAAYYFKADAAGGPSASLSGVPHSALGGGLRRWRTAVRVDGRWTNIVDPCNSGVYIPDSDTRAIGARVARFGEILPVLPPSEIVATAREMIRRARERLRNSPASCSARTEREFAFEFLRQAAEFYWVTEAELDAQFRTLEDYVFAELEYAEAKTCCWNSTTRAMRDIIMDYAEREQDEANAQGMCVAPTVFRATGGGDGYNVFRQHAVEMGLGSEWRAWSDDEPCPQANRGSNDALSNDHPVAGWCERELTETVCDPGAVNNSVVTSPELLVGHTLTQQVCGTSLVNPDNEEGNWYYVSGGGTVTVTFDASDEDIDVYAFDLDSSLLARSEGRDSPEVVTCHENCYILVTVNEDALMPYTIRLTN